MAFAYFRTVTLDATLIPSDQTDFPICVVATDADLATVGNGGHVENSNGYDICFFSDSGLTTPLTWETELYVAATGQIVFWVKIPTASSSTDTVFYMAYGDPTITTFQSTATAVWDSNFKAVYHLGEASNPYLDSTSNNNDSSSGTYPTQVGAQIGEGQSFDDSVPNYIRFPAALSSGLQGTFCGWAKYSSSGPAADQYFLTITSRLWIYLLADGRAKADATFVSGIFSSASYKDDNWHFWTVRINAPGGSCVLWIDGAGVGGNGSSAAFNFPDFFPGNEDLGRNNVSGAGPSDAVFDEVRLSNSYRSNDWIVAEYNTQTTFPVLGAESPITSDQTIIPGAPIPSEEAWGEPVITGADLTIIPSMIGPAQTWPNPTVAGPITLAAPIPSAASWPAPIVKLQQRITLAAAIPSAAVWGSPRVAFVTLVSPAAPIPSAAVWPTPVITGGPQWINLATIPSPARWPVPTVDGGLLACRIYIGGVERTDILSYVEPTSITSQTIGRWRCEFGFEVANGVSGYSPEIGQSVLIVDHGYRAFAGCITEYRIERLMMTSYQIKYHCTAVDKSGLCDHRIVKGSSYPIGSDVVTVIIDIATNYLTGEGISLGTLPPVGALGTLGVPLPLNYVTVTNAFDQVANASGTVWWVDSYAQLHFDNLLNLPAAPIELTETSRNWQYLVVTPTTTDYYNVLYAVSNLNILPGSGAGSGGGSGNTETFTLTPGAPGVLSFPDGTIFGIQCSAAIGSIQSLTVNGSPATFQDAGAFAGTFTDWTWSGPASGNPSSLVTTSVVYPPAATLVIVYVPWLSTGSSLAQTNPPLTPPGRCGSGIYEGVIQVQNIADQPSLDAIAAAALERIGGIPVTASFQTTWPGLAPGQVITADIPLSAMVGQFLITGMSGAFVPPELDHGGSFWWTVECRNNLDPGNWIKWFERLIGRTANPLPVYSYERASWVLGAGSTLAGGVPAVNPYIVGNTGKVVDISIAAATPPTNQDLFIFVEADGSPVAQITMPGGSPANVSITYEIPPEVLTYVFQGQVLTLEVVYQITGVSPTRAANVTVQIRIAY